MLKRLSQGVAENKYNGGNIICLFVNLFASKNITKTKIND